MSGWDIKRKNGRKMKSLSSDELQKMIEDPDWKILKAKKPW
jgi:hypothetical protein